MSCLIKESLSLVTLVVIHEYSNSHQLYEQNWNKFAVLNIVSSCTCVVKILLISIYSNSTIIHLFNNLIFFLYYILLLKY